MPDCNTTGTSRTSRRTFLAGAMATGVLAACSSDGGSGETAGSASTVEPGAIGLFTIVKRFPQRVQVPGEVRLPINLSTGAADFIQDAPPTLGAQITDLDGKPIGGRITTVRRDVTPAPYYAFRPVIDEVGFYTMLVDGGPADGVSFEVAAPSSVPVPIPGEFLPGFETPTIGNPAGVDPICTHTPEMCPFHTISLAAALNVDRPVAYCVGTPAFCQTGSCAPALDSLIDIRERYADTVTFVHAEIYTDDTATVVAPAVEALGLFYEPALFVTDASGVIVDRLDGLWEASEASEVLDKALA